MIFFVMIVFFDKKMIFLFTSILFEKLLSIM